MPNTRLIKSRIKSANNIAKITKAMEMVSASKMRRAQQQVQASRPYASKLQGVLNTIATHTDSSLHPLLQLHGQGRPLLIILSTDRGLCGGLNTNLFKAVLEFQTTHPNLAVITVGRRAQEFAQRVSLELVASFTNLPEKISFNDILPLAEAARSGFLDHEYSTVSVVHMEFINTLTQKSQVIELLPLAAKNFAGTTEETTGEYHFEPNPQEILNWLLPYYVEMELYQLLLDAKASEHSARMISMQNASNNAKDVVGSLRLEYNKGRQASITKELLEITTASLSLQK